MSDWSNNYHRRQLEMETGMRWAPTPVSVSRALAELETARGAVSAIRSTVLILTAVIVGAAGMVIGGIFAAIFNWLPGGSGALGLIIPGVFIFGCTVAARVGIILTALPPRERGLMDAEEAYQAALDRAVA